MPNYTQYPAGIDLIQRLKNIGLSGVVSSNDDVIAGINMDADSIMLAAVSEFEYETDYVPFLAGSQDTTRSYDPSGPERRHSGHVYSVIRGGSKYLEIDGGLVSLTSVVTGITFDDTGTPQTGITRVLNRDFTIRPENAPARNRPYEWIEFFFPMYGMANSIQITGKFGFCTTLPAQVWRAILDRGVAIVLNDTTPAVNNGVIRWQEADSAEAFAEMPFEKVIALIDRRWRKTIEQYKRMDMHI